MKLRCSQGRSLLLLEACPLLGALTRMRLRDSIEWRRLFVDYGYGYASSLLRSF